MGQIYLTRSAFLTAILVAFSANVFGQSRCFTDEEFKKAIESIKSVPSFPAPENKKLRNELLDMIKERSKLKEKIAIDPEKNKDLFPVFNQLAVKQLLRVCQMINENGWLTKQMVKEDGFEAFSFVIANNNAVKLQREIMPVLVQAAKKEYIGLPMIASLADSIRVGYGLPQIFGTQATIKENVIYLSPFLNDEKVNDWRKEYGLPPIALAIKRLEQQYSLPVVRTQRRSRPQRLDGKNGDKDPDTSVLGISDDENETLKVEIKVVNLNVRVLTQTEKIPTGVSLAKEDFTIVEDGVEQEVTFFTKTEEPFDLVLLLDFSSSTTEKRGLIKKAAQRFVEYARAGDRIAVVAFATKIEIVSVLTTDKDVLTKKIKDIKLEGNSPVWDSLKFTYENIIKKESDGRRSAVVFMTDGEDGSPNTTFADIIEMVRHEDTTIFSVYLKANSSLPKEWVALFSRRAQQSLTMLAEESGGQFYRVSDIKNLDGIYEQVINDLGKVFSVGYEPKNDNRDGGWRSVEVKIKTKPDLIAKTRRGYYAN